MVDGLEPPDLRLVSQSRRVFGALCYATEGAEAGLVNYTAAVLMLARDRFEEVDDLEPQVQSRLRCWIL